MGKITYNDKVKINELPDVPAINKVQDVDMNEIKTSVNTIYDALGLGTDTFSTSTSYVVGDLVIYNGMIYKCITATSGAWNPANWSLVPIFVDANINDEIKGMLFENEYSDSTTEGYSANYVNNLANKFKFTKKYTYNGTNMSTTNGTVRDYSSINIHTNDDESVVYIQGTLYNNHSTEGGATVTFATPLRPTNNVSIMNILTFYSNQQVGENMDISTNGTVSMMVYGTANGNSRHAIIPVLIFLD